MLPSCPNLRDIGGFATAGGGRVRTGLLFRSGTLSGLGHEDRSVLEPLGIRTICDLRRQHEREDEPTRWHDATVRTLTWEYPQLVSELMRSLTSAESAVAAMDAFYRRLPGILAEPIRGVFAVIADGGTPLLFHCAAGKDRTGAVAALLQDVLGVPRAAVLADYARSGELVDYEAVLMAAPESGLGLSRDGVSLATLPPASRACLLASDPRYLAAMFDEIETRWGSSERYLVEVLGIDAATIDSVKTLLIE